MTNLTCRAFTCLCLCFSLPLAAQRPGNPPAGQLPPEDVQHEDKDVTIAKCITQLADDDASIRRRAVLVLSKYPEESAAVQGLIRALQDDHPDVRQAAVVSIVENNLFPNAAPQLLPLLADPNVHIRRTISTFLRRIIYSPTYLLGRANQSFPANDQKILRQAMQDPDPLVRKNMLNNFGTLKTVLDIDHILPLLQDQQPDIRRLALNAAWEYLQIQPGRFATIAEPLIDDPDHDVRFFLAQLLQRSRHDDKSRDLLRQLVDDPSQQVVTEARLALLQSGDRDQWTHLRTILDEHRLDVKTAERIIRAAGTLDDQGQALLDLLDHSKPLYRASAIRTYSLFHRTRVQAVPIWDALDDDFAPVRQEAAQLLLAIPPDKLPEDLQKRLMDLVRHPHTDVRALAVDLIQKLPEDDQQRDLLQEFLLDDDAAIRAKTVGQLIRRRLGDWQQIAKLAVEDQSPDVRFAVIDALTTMKTSQHQQLLQEIKLSTQDRELLQRIQQKTTP